MKLIITLLLSCLSLSIHTSEEKLTLKEIKEQAVLKIKKNYNRLVEAIILQESGGNPNAIGADNDAGLLQITPVRLRHFNRVTHKNYSLNDRFNPHASREIFDYFALKIGLGKHEEIARRWNGGQNGMNKQSTIKYWKEVKNKYKENQNYVQTI